MIRRHLISLADLTPDDLLGIVERAAKIGSDPASADRMLTGKVVGIFFQHTSTRTRTAFSSGAVRLGADIVSYGPGDLQLNTGETVHDTARVMASMLDALVIRNSVPMEQLRMFSVPGAMSVINAMCAEEHPTQALADLATLRTVFGGLAGLRVLYLGEGNNTAAALALGCAMVGAELHLRTPYGYGVETTLIDRARSVADGDLIRQRHDMWDLPAEVDVVYTTRWQTTGTTKPSADWRTHFASFQVNDALMDLFPAARFMHDLPAHRGEEVTATVLDGDRSIAFQQARFKLYSAMAALEWCLLA